MGGGRAGLASKLLMGQGWIMKVVRQLRYGECGTLLPCPSLSEWLGSVNVTLKLGRDWDSWLLGQLARGRASV